MNAVEAAHARGFRRIYFNALTPPYWGVHVMALVGLFTLGFSWTGLLTELEKALPGPSYIRALTPSFTPEGAVALQMRVTSRSLDDLLVFLNGLTAGGFKDVKAGGEQRIEDGRLIAEITATYARPL